MKKIIKSILGVLVILMVMVPNTIVSAKTKEEAFIEKLEELVSSFKGTLTYEDDIIDINWTFTNSESTTITFDYHDNIIEYDSGELTSYEDAIDVLSHTIYSFNLIEEALKLNGYTEEEITEFFSDANNELNYEVNGIEIKKTSEAKEFTSEDGNGKLTIAPMQVKIDITKANLNKATDPAFEPKDITIEEFVENLQNNEEFASYESDGKQIYQNEIYIKDETIVIDHIDYFDEYYNALFSFENGIITYEDNELEDYSAAERSMSHYMFLTQMIQIALEINGYTEEEIKAFFTNENMELSYEINGIELKEIGEEKEYTSEDGSSKITVTPIQVKIDINRASINKADNNYKILEGANQIASSTGTLTFRFSIDYLKFKNEGKVYVDGKEIDSSNYTLSEGSTIITFNNNFVKNLSATEHVLKVTVSDGEVETKFEITNNPQTGDNILVYVSLLGLSIIGLAGIGLNFKKNRVK